MKKIALFPGSFDPITLGHVDIIKRGSQLFDELYVGVFTNTNKKTWFTPEEKVALMSEVLKDLPNVKVIAEAQNLTVEIAKKYQAQYLLRGIRSVKDFEYEKDIALMNGKLEDSIESVFLLAQEKYSFVSSSMIKEVFTFGGDIAAFVPQEVLKALKEKQV